MNKIVIIDDHQLFLYGLKLMLEKEDYLVMTFDSPLKALPEIEKINPDLILMDLYTPEMSVFTMLDTLLKAEVSSPLIVFSSSENYNGIYHALQKGAMGFISKFCSLEMLKNALNKVFSGDLFIPDDIVVELESVAQLEEKNIQKYHFSDRQMQILRLLQVGINNQEIADKLCISRDTVKFHQKGLYLALDVSGTSSRLKAVEKAISIGLLKA